MNKLRIITIIILLTFINYSNSQTITGNVRFQSDRNNYQWTFAKIDGVKTECDSTGNFELSNINNIDTLLIIPIPIFISVCIYNFPNNIDSLHLDSIPLFKNLNRTIPIINFKSKRASKRYFKKLDKERKSEKEELIKEISNYKFLWKDRGFKLKVIESDKNLFILIDLNQ